MKKWKVNKHPYPNQPRYIITEEEYLAQNEKGEYLTEGIAEVPSNETDRRYLVALVDNNKNFHFGLRSLEESEQVAKLIAAAPELRAAVETARDLLLSATVDPVRRAEVVQMLDDVLHKCDRASD